MSHLIQGLLSLPEVASLPVARPAGRVQLCFTADHRLVCVRSAGNFDVWPAQASLIIDTFGKGNGTWTKPSGVTFVEVVAVGGGGGGGAGQQAPLGTAAYGGSGGSPGAFQQMTFPGGLVPATVRYQCGGGGAGGTNPGAPGVASNGGNGTQGSSTMFGMSGGDALSSSLLLIALPGPPGAGGAGAIMSPGQPVFWNGGAKTSAGSIAGQSADNGTGLMHTYAGATWNWAVTGGGGGGGGNVTTAGVVSNGGAGGVNIFLGNSEGGVAGTSGSDGGSGAAFAFLLGSGGGGGGGNTNLSGGNGGSGGAYGSGGGAGGASNYKGGNGGAGADGTLVILSRR